MDIYFLSVLINVLQPFVYFSLLRLKKDMDHFLFRVNYLREFLKHSIENSIKTLWRLRRD